MLIPSTTLSATLLATPGNPLVVNKEGKRFVNETGKRTDLALAVMDQPDQLCYIIACDQNSNIMPDGRNFDGEPAEGLSRTGLPIEQIRLTNSQIRSIFLPVP